SAGVLRRESHPPHGGDVSRPLHHHDERGAGGGRCGGGAAAGSRARVEPAGDSPAPESREAMTGRRTLLLGLVLLAGCVKKPPDKRYTLTGDVLSLNPQTQTTNI